jgi:3',5'-cyclic AMP phosphodiesterase CpdA
MKRLAWLTDIHLNFVPLEGVVALYEEIRDAKPDAVIISGDIGEAHNLEGYLLALEKNVHVPIYFVLGNHDFYRGSISAVRANVSYLTSRSNYLRWLPLAGVVELTSKTSLIGHDGWGDARLGNYAQSPICLNDFFLIRELAWLDTGQRTTRLRELGDEAAAYLTDVLPKACERSQHVILATHVPPFREAAWYDGRPSDDDWLPFFCCKAVGDVLVKVMQSRPGCRLTVLCGHTHGSGTATILPNLQVHTGGAKYGAPKIQMVWEIE